MSLHSNMRAMVIRMLGTGRGGNGVLCALHKFTPGDFDASIGEYLPGFTNDYVGTGVRVNYTERSYVNVEIHYGDFQIYLSPVQANGIDEMPTPAVDDTITFNGRSAKVIRVHPFNDNTDNCGWKLQVRYG